MGGNAQGRYDTVSGYIEERSHPEMFDTLNPANGWTTLAGQTTPIRRGYHSTALLTPNAEVLVAGGEGPGDNPDESGSDQRKMQIFTPPYGGDTSWKTSGNRPTIGSPTPSEFWIGEALEVAYTVASGREPERLTLISLGATTHAFNQHQHVTFLPFEAGEDSLSFDWQAHHYHLPPGYYMLFLVDDDGIPSVAKIVRLKDVDRTLMGSGTLNSGFYFGVLAYPSQLAVGDQGYVGGWIYRSSGFVTSCYLDLNGTAPQEDYTRFAVYSEFKTNGTYGYQVSAYDWIADDWVPLASGTTTANVEVGLESAASPADLQPFVEEGTKAVKLRISFTGVDSGFRAYIDRVEVRTR